MGNSTFRTSKYGRYATFIDTEALNGATASIFGEGSLTMIVAIFALATSVVSICITVAPNKKNNSRKS